MLLKVIEKKNFRIRAIAITANKDELKWLLFQKEHQDRSKLSLVLAEIKHLKVKNFQTTS